MEFKAFKMDGLGNDFIIIDQRSKNIKLSNDQIVKICDRKFIGCDQLIFIICSFVRFVIVCLLSMMIKSLPKPSILKALISIYRYLTYLLTF